MRIILNDGTILSTWRNSNIHVDNTGMRPRLWFLACDDYVKAPGAHKEMSVLAQDVKRIES